MDTGTVLVIIGVLLLLVTLFLWRRGRAEKFYADEHGGVRRDLEKVSSRIHSDHNLEAAAKALGEAEEYKRERSLIRAAKKLRETQRYLREASA